MARPTNRPVWKVARLARVSAVTGEAFPADVPIVTALFGDDAETPEDGIRGTGFVRRDFLEAEATEEHLEGAYCVWRTRTPPAKPDAAERRLDLEMARQLLTRLLAEGDPQRAPACMTLALLLVRKRRLNLVDAGPTALEVRWPKEKETFQVPSPEVTPAEAEALQQDLLRLFDLDPETPAGSAPVRKATADDDPSPSEDATDEVEPDVSTPA